MLGERTLFLRLQEPEKLHQGRDPTDSDISIETEGTNADYIEKMVINMLLRVTQLELRQETVISYNILLMLKTS